MFLVSSRSVRLSVARERKLWTAERLTALGDACDPFPLSRDDVARLLAAAGALIQAGVPVHSYIEDADDEPWPVPPPDPEPDHRLTIAGKVAEMAGNVRRLVQAIDVRVEHRAGRHARIASSG